MSDAKGPLKLFDDPGDARPHVLRDPCKYCGATTGHIAPKNGQSVVICNGCSRGLYNAPRTETGERKTTGDVVHRAITRSVRAAVLGIGARTLPLHFIVALLRTRQRRAARGAR